ncbi:hypothetical protein FG379_001336 [Cryptosporidium bovis]|uniref:uncharacterized protein n=1 Tax=Cryptosporidium bovis TaxID=310047 RepID=UPI00351A1129|nr:hypothetical protein FG379_001336 [Cryptosporidium bovis]
MDTSISEKNEALNSIVRESYQKTQIPKVINVPHLVSGRSSEILKFISFIRKSNSIKRCFQRLPPSIRRRSMSYNIYRAPKKIRSTLFFEVNKALPRISNRKKNKKIFNVDRNLVIRAVNHRNIFGIELFPLKVRNITEISNIFRDNRRNINCEVPLNQFRWLESHLFHAKRFHMCEAFGYKLPFCSTLKRSRKIYRAIKHHFVVHDSSYLHIFEITGMDSEISLLFKLCNFDTSFLFDEKYYCGYYRGGGFMFKLDDNKFIYASNRMEFFEELNFFSWERIAPIEFLWIPNCKNCNSNRSLWIWIHPIASYQLFVYLEKCIKFYNLKININLVEDLNRLEVMGPKSLDIFKNIISEEYSIFLHNEVSNSIKQDAIYSFQVNIPTSYKSYKKKGHITSCKLETINECKDIVSSRCSFFCIGLRQSLREESSLIKKSKHKQNKDASKNIGTTFVSLPTNRSNKKTLRNLVLKINERNENKKMKTNTNSSRQINSNGQLHEISSNIVLIFHQGSRRGFDILIPRGLNSTVLLRHASSLHGQIIGIKERRIINLEFGIPSFPYDYVETLSYQKLQITNCITSRFRDSDNSCLNEVLNTYNYIKTPKGKRVNYHFNKIEFPFLINWDKILGKGDKDRFYINNSALFKNVLAKVNGNMNTNNIVENFNVFVPRNGYRGTLKEERLFFDGMKFDRNNLFKSLIMVKIHSNFKVNTKSHIYMCEKNDNLNIAEGKKLFEKPQKCKKPLIPNVNVDFHLNNILLNCDFNCLRKLVGVVLSGGFSMEFGKGFGIGCISFDSFLG